MPAVGLSSLSWDVVLERLETNLRDEHVPIIRQIRHSYRYADLMIRVAPALPMPAFRHSLDIAAIAAPAASEPDALRGATNASSDERIVAVAFGGIPLTSLPWARIEQMHGYRFIIPGEVPQSSRQIISAESIPMTFPSIMASSDLLLTKPGYGTIVDAVATRRRVVYVRRYNFADEDVLIDYLHRYGCGIELSAGDFLDGRWEDTMDAVIDFPPLRLPLLSRAGPKTPPISLKPICRGRGAHAPFPGFVTSPSQYPFSSAQGRLTIRSFRAPAL